MNKVKKIVSSVLAGVMALSMMSIGASADTCGHPSAVLKRVGVASVYQTSHKVSVTIGSHVEQVVCTRTHLIHNKAYICSDCGIKIRDAGTEEEIRHSINHGE